MIISDEQLNNISKTIYYLMRGMYNLKVFHSPYNFIIADELDEKKGRAVKEFHLMNDKMDSLTKLFNDLDGSDEEEYKLIEEFFNCNETVLEELCTGSIITGYRIKKKIICLDIGSCPFETYFKNQLLMPDGFCAESYKKLQASILEMEDQFVKQGDQTGRGKKILDELQQVMHSEYSILTNIGFLHGLKLGADQYPIWINPSL